MNIRNKLGNYFNAGYAGTFIQSYEEQRVLSELLGVCKDIGFDLYVWTVTDSLIGPMGKKDKDDKPIPPNTFMSTVDPSQPLGPIELLEMMIPKDGKLVLPEKSVILAKDFHLFVEDRNPVLIRKVKDALSVGRLTNRRLVVLGCQYKLCAELEKEFTPVEFSLPDREALKLVMLGIAESAGQQLNGATEPLVDASSGMTTTEAEDAAALSVIESEKHELDPKIIAREKSNVVKKSGLLEVVESNIGLDDIGGLENLKRDLFEKRNLFTKAARDYGLVTPRGMLVCGQPGTGKSLTATATGNIFGVPLLRLEAGRLFGSLVGESERNWRTAFSTIRAIAPAVLHIDEVDGLFAGAASSGQTDGGTTARVIKAILQDMQFNSEGIFYIFTANDIDRLPDPLIDRLDVWSVELPNQVEREQIWKIHIAKRKRDPENYSIPTLAKITEGFSGRQIEQAWLKSLTRAFNDGGREPTNDDVTAVASMFVATSITMASQIEARRKRLQNRAQPAGQVDHTATSFGTTRKLNP